MPLVGIGPAEPGSGERKPRRWQILVFHVIFNGRPFVPPNRRIIPSASCGGAAIFLQRSTAS